MGSICLIELNRSIGQSKTTLSVYMSQRLDRWGVSKKGKNVNVCIAENPMMLLGMSKTCAVTEPKNIHNERNVG